MEFHQKRDQVQWILIGRTTGLRLYMPMSCLFTKMSWQQRSEESSGLGQREMLLMLKWLRGLVIVGKMTIPWTLTNGGQKTEVY
jgi:hypothetical protein